jgi:hypothetical protein
VMHRLTYGNHYLTLRVRNPIFISPPKV